MDHEEQEPRLFSLTEAERTRREVEPVLIEAVEARRKITGLGEKLSAISSRIMMMGGLTVRYEDVARLRIDHDRLAEQIKEAIEKIHATGCLIKDLDAGLLDFPSVRNNEEIYLCWRLGEDRIRFWHRQNEGFAGRKPIDSSDPGSKHPIQ